jgi:hypothetical protein
MSDQESAGGEGLRICKRFAILHEPQLICTRLRTFLFLIPYQYRRAQMISSGAMQFVGPHARRRRRKFFTRKCFTGKCFAGRMRRCAFR